MTNHVFLDFRDGLGYLRQADAERDVPILFDFLTEAG